MSKRKKVEVDDLEFGMYVAELDRAWLGSPFLFQGFFIETDDDLEKVRGYCEHVFVDEERVMEEIAGEEADDDRTIRRSINVRPDISPVVPKSKWNKMSEEERKLTFETEIKKAASLRSRTRGYIDKLFNDTRMGFSVDTDTAKEVVHELVETISQDADTALWLTSLKNAHEYTAQHCVNVSVLAIVFGKHLSFNKDQLKLIGLGALLHDVGKMKVPIHILDKPGKLTPDEFEIIKRHPVDGYEIMKATGTVPQQSLDIIRYHHERLSGRGYPDGLKGDQISTAVLMVAICDVYDAVTSDRAYHHGIPAHDALNALYQVAPGEFGKELMQEFIRCIGIYPVGSAVQLATGDVGIVLSTDPQNKLRPVVLLVRDKEGNEYRPRRYISLSAMATTDKSRDWSVKRIINPANLEISMRQLADEEMLHGGSEFIHL